MSAYEFDEATLKKVEQFSQKLEDAQADIIKYSIKKQEPVFTERDAFLNDVKEFWQLAMLNCPAVAVYIDDEDREAFKSLERIRVERNLQDPREATIHFDFGENEFFSDKTLTKVFKVTEDAEPLGSDDFDFSSNVQSEPLKINWKSEDKNLSKRSPTTLDDPEADADEADGVMPGSFFSSFFEHQLPSLATSIGDNLINEFYPRAIDYYLGEVDDDEMYFDSDDDEDLEDDEEDEEDEEDDAAEIDLEEEEARQAKKSKK